MLFKNELSTRESDTGSQCAFGLIVFQVPRLFKIEVVIGEPTIANFRSVRMHGELLELKKAQSFMLQQGILCSMSSKGFVEAPSVWVEDEHLHSIKKTSHNVSFAVFGNVAAEKLHDHEIIDEVSANYMPIQSMIGCSAHLEKVV